MPKVNFSSRFLLLLFQLLANAGHLPCLIWLLRTLKTRIWNFTQIESICPKAHEGEEAKSELHQSFFPTVSPTGLLSYLLPPDPSSHLTEVGLPRKQRLVNRRFKWSAPASLRGREGERIGKKVSSYNSTGSSEARMVLPSCSEIEHVCQSFIHWPITNVKLPQEVDIALDKVTLFTETVVPTLGGNVSPPWKGNWGAHHGTCSTITLHIHRFKMAAAAKGFGGVFCLFFLFTVF